MQERIVVDDADWKVEVKGDIAFMVRTHVAALMLNSRREKKRKTNTLTHTHTLSLNWCQKVPTPSSVVGTWITIEGRQEPWWEKELSYTRAPLIPFQHKSSQIKIVCNPETTLLRWFDTGISFKDPELVTPRSLRWIGNKTCRRSMLDGRKVHLYAI